MVQVKAGPLGNYGSDDRKDYFEISDPLLKKVAKSTATIINKNKLTKLPNGNFQQKTSKTAADIGMCPDAKFSSQKIFGHCSGSLVGKDQFLSAAHCYNEIGSDSYKDMYVVFDYLLDSPSQVEIEIKKENVYEIKELLYHEFSNRPEVVDLSLVRLDRVVNRAPLKINRAFKYTNGTKLFMIGYPIGLPLKYTDNATITKVDTERSAFATNLDSYSSNSGSSIFDVKTKEIIGVLVRGNSQDFKMGACLDWGVAYDYHSEEGMILWKLPNF